MDGGHFSLEQQERHGGIGAVRHVSTEHGNGRAAGSETAGEILIK